MTTYPTIQDLINDGTIRAKCSAYFNSSGRVDFRGDGWYSLDGENIFRPDCFPTTCRIWLSYHYHDEPRDALQGIITEEPEQ